RRGPAAPACVGGEAAPVRGRGDPARCGRGSARSRPAARVVRSHRADPVRPHRHDNNSPKEGLMRRMTWLVVLVTLAVAGTWMAAPALSQSKVVKIGDLGSKVGVFEGYGKYQTMGMQL